MKFVILLIFFTCYIYTVLPAQDVSDHSIIRDAVAKAEIYLQKKGDTLNPRTIMNAYYVNRKFNKPELMVLDGFPGRVYPTGTMRIFNRFLNGKVIISYEEIEALNNPMDKVLALALHCDFFSSDNLVQEIKQLGFVDDNGLNNALFSLTLLLDNNCFERGDPQISNLITVLSDRAFSRLNYSTQYDNPQLQMIAKLYYLGEGKRVQGTWIKRVLAYQKEDGSWPDTERLDNGSDLATILALWVLLEYSYPETAHTSWIP